MPSDVTIRILTITDGHSIAKNHAGLYLDDIYANCDDFHYQL